MDLSNVLSPDMPLSALQAELHRRDIRLRVEAGGLRFAAPKGAMTDELRAVIAHHKPALLAALAQADGQASGALMLSPAPEARHAPFPMTDLQQAYWVGEKGGYAQTAIPCYVHHVRVPGLTRARLQAALEALQSRHEVLRTRFTEDGQQQIARPGTLPAQALEEDLSDLRSDEADARAAALALDFPDTCLPDLCDGPPLAAKVLHTPNADPELILCLRLIVLDGPSLAVIFRDFLSALANEPLSPPPPAKAPCYRDYVLGLAALPRARAEAYWQDTLPELADAPALPCRSQPPQRSQFARLRHQIPTAQWAELQSRAQSRGITPNALMIALYAAVLRPWSEHKDFTLNVLTNYRPFGNPGIAQITGNHSNMILTDCHATGSFVAQARAIQASIAERMPHAVVSGVSLLRRLQQMRAADRPAVPFVFTSGISAGTAPLPAALSNRVEQISSQLRTPQVWLDHQVIETHEGLLCYWDYVQGIFEPGLPKQMLARFQCAVLALLQDPAAFDRVDPVPAAALPAASRGPDIAPGDTVGSLFLAQAAASPDAPALIEADGRCHRYAALAEEATAAAAGLRAQGIGRGDLVAVHLPKGAPQIIACLAISLSGAAWLPLDTGLPAARKHAILLQSGARALLGKPSGAAGTGVDLPPHLDLSDLHQTGSAEHRPVGQASDLAYVIYTSGSTGQPKGVAISQSAVLNTLLDLRQRFALGAGDRIFAISALGFDLSVFDIWGSLISGAAIILPPDAPVPDPAQLLHQARRDGVTIWNTVPALLDMLFLHAPAETVAADLASLRLIMLSGDWIPMPLARNIRGHLGHAAFYSLGGATEAAIWSNLHYVTDVPTHWRSVPYGRALSGQQLHVLDPTGAPCPPHATGEIHIEGAGLAQGYYRDPQRTAESFITHASGRRLYATGDLGRTDDDGIIEFLGRKDYQLKLRGHRIEAGEIETCLTARPEIDQAAILLAPTPQGQDVLAAIYVPSAPGQLPDDQLLRQHLADRLPRYMVPDILLANEALPLSSNGKRDMKALRSLAREALAARTGQSGEAGRSNLPDRGKIPAEMQPLERLWAEVCGHPPQAPDAHFFQSGGTSMLAVRLARRIEDTHGIALPLATIFAHPTLAGLWSQITHLTSQAPERSAS